VILERIENSFFMKVGFCDYSNHVSEHKIKISQSPEYVHKTESFSGGIVKP
jgi:uncharacterized short protein YbdD (DUF466 family)